MRIVVSYRRADSSGWTGRLVEELQARFGAGSTFYDLQSMGAGVDYVREISTRLEGANYTLVIIGPAWLNATSDAGHHRLEDPYDPVRMEVALALRSKCAVIPILVGGARMPEASMLPSDLSGLATRNAVELTDRRWSEDLKHLITSLAGTIWWKRIILTFVGLIQLAFVVLWILQSVLQNEISEKEGAAEVLRQNYIQKIQVASDECMAGTWPAGAVKGKTYAENGHEVTPLCSGVSIALDNFGEFFNNDQLWRRQSSRQTAAAFVRTYTEVFMGNLEAMFNPPLSGPALNLAKEARDYMAPQAQQVVKLKQDAGQVAAELNAILRFTRLGFYWTIAVGLYLIVSLGRGAVSWRAAGRVSH